MAKISPSICVWFLFISIVNGLNDVTTLYEINTFQSDLEGVKYLNTCTVSVHVQAKDAHLPLYNIHGDDAILGKKIPPLFNYRSAQTVWKHLDGSEMLAYFDFKTFDMTLPPLSHLLLQRFPKQVIMSKSGLVFDETEMAALYDNTDALPFNSIVVGFYKTGYRRIQLYWDTNESHFIEITTRKGDNVTVCYYNEKIDCIEFEFYYSSNENSFSRLVITLYGELIVSDLFSPPILHTNLYLPKGVTKYTRIKHVQDDTSSVDYHLYRARVAHIVSPWLELKDNTAIFIFYFAKPGNTVNASLEEEKEEDTNSVEQLEGLELERVSYTTELERVLTKVNIPSWTGKKRIRIDGANKLVIGNIWERTEFDQYKIQDAMNCAKSNMMDIYNTMERGGTNAEAVDTCFNGGRLKNATCACPPGFAGNQCELPCDRNSFGQTCSSVCSKSSNECKGMILCTPDYGCTCAPGYYGDQCIEQCQQGTYGADCAQTCDHCKGGCDRYTGACTGACSKPYFIHPNCRQTHSYLKKVPEIMDTSFNSIKLQVDLTPNNVVRSSANVMFYLVQYRKDNSNEWNDGPSEVFSPVMSNILVEGLNPGQVYEFRVLLIDETQENQDPSLSKSTNVRTKCLVSVNQEYLQVTSKTNTSISLSWDNETGSIDTECPSINYLLELDEVTDTGYVKTKEIVNIKRNSYILETLSPGQTYFIKLKKITINGETVIISSKNITTDDTVDLSKEVVGLTIKKTDSQIKIDWFPRPYCKKYYAKYKLKRYLSCNTDAVDSPLEVKETTNTTLGLLLLDLEPYAYYKLFVTMNKNQKMKKFNSSFITPGSVPTDSPTFSSDVKVTNKSIHLFLTNYSISCQRMNGVFKRYRIELYDYSEKLIQSYETQDGDIDITGLTSETQYLVKIYYVNHVGFNPTVSLQHKFTTKPDTLVRELTAYKTTATMIGLRWKVPDMSTILAINIELRTATENKTIIPTSSFQCKPWPGLLCYEVNGLVENTIYTITVNAFSKDWPEGRESKPILVVSKETAPSAVSEITLIHNAAADTNMTLSWRIPYTLNGTLRSFDIEVEQLSAFDDKICCQIKKVNYPVSAEQEIYSLILQDIKPASSYEITVRPLAKRLGPEAKEIIETPPPRLPFQRVPLVKIGNKKIEFPMQNNSEDSSDKVYNKLATEILIIKQIVGENETKEASETPYTDSIRAEMSRILGSNNWVLIHVCKVVDVNCTVDVEPVSNDLGHSSRIILVQVNQYLSAKSYTLLESSQ